ncbi:hypothetical protein IFM89_012975, partial [Coptis chinensis]
IASSNNGLCYKGGGHEVKFPLKKYPWAKTKQKANCGCDQFLTSYRRHSCIKLGSTAIGLKKVLCLLFEGSLLNHFFWPHKTKATLFLMIFLGMWMSMKRWSPHAVAIAVNGITEVSTVEVEVVEAPVHSGQDEVLPVTEPRLQQIRKILQRSLMLQL